jgi:hypothetical protein
VQLRIKHYIPDKFGPEWALSAEFDHWIRTITLFRPLLGSFRRFTAVLAHEMIHAFIRLFADPELPGYDAAVEPNRNHGPVFQAIGIVIEAVRGLARSDASGSSCVLVVWSARSSPPAAPDIDILRPEMEPNVREGGYVDHFDSDDDDEDEWEDDWAPPFTSLPQMFGPGGPFGPPRGFGGFGF